MANSLIADLLKTPSQARQALEEQLQLKGALAAKPFMGGGATASPISGAISRLTGTMMQQSPLAAQQMVSRGLGGLGSIAGALGAPDAAQALKRGAMSPEEQQAADIQKAAMGIGGSPDKMRAFADKLRSMGRADLAQRMDEKATELEMQQEELSIKREELALKRMDKGERFKTVGNRIFDVKEQKFISPEEAANATDSKKPYDDTITITRDGVKVGQHIKYVGGKPTVVNEWNIPTDLSVTMQKELTTAQDKYISADAKIGQIDNLILGLKENPFEGGVTKQATEAIKGITGDLDLRSYMDMEFKNLRSKEAMDNLPPGSASDADVRLALSGVPPENASSEFITKWLKAVKSVNKKVAEYQKFKAKYISSKGNTRDMISEWEGEKRKITAPTEAVLNQNGTVDFFSLPTQ